MARSRSGRQRQRRRRRWGCILSLRRTTVAPYFVEEVRRQLEKQYGVEQVHGAGLRVYTTLDLDLQQVANKAILDGTATYERRHGWKGNLPNVVLDGADVASYRHPDWAQPIEKGSYVHGVVTTVSAKKVTVKLGTQQAVLTPEDWKWTQNPDGDSFLRIGRCGLCEGGERRGGWHAAGFAGAGFGSAGFDDGGG